jgi:hypothetical protein
MTVESLHAGYRRSSLEHRRDECCRAVRWHGTATVRVLDRTAQQKWLMWVLPDVPLTGQAPGRAETQRSRRRG